MVRLIWLKNFHRWTEEAGHAFLILIVTIIIPILSGEFAFMRGWEAIYRGFFRFFRIAFFLCLPLYMLLPIYSKLGSVFRKMKGVLIQIEGKQELEIHPRKHWLFRPFQGIGIGLLFASKLLGVLQIVTGSTAKAPLFLPESHFQPGRLLIATGITVLLSLFLSALWTMDDLGIRYFNREDYEIKMVGKYVGTLMPIVFGLYGILGLFGAFSKLQTLVYLFQAVVILYPPFTVFSIFHLHFVQRKVEDLSKRLNVEKWSPSHQEE
jgi:uncharacterized membrane protein (DUF441 family)